MINIYNHLNDISEYNKVFKEGFLKSDLLADFSQSPFLDTVTAVTVLSGRRVPLIS